MLHLAFDEPGQRRQHRRDATGQLVGGHQYRPERDRALKRFLRCNHCLMRYWKSRSQVVEHGEPGDRGGGLCVLGVAHPH